MDSKIGRNDPCPCGSGKKYKQCCLDKEPVPKSPSLLVPSAASEPAKRKFKAVVLNQASPAPKQPPNLMDRIFGVPEEGEIPQENLLATELYPERPLPPKGQVSPVEPPLPEK